MKSHAHTRAHPIIAITRAFRIGDPRRGVGSGGKKFKLRFDARTPFAWHDFTEHLSKESRKSPPPPCPSPRERSRLLLEISPPRRNIARHVTRGGMYDV